LQALHHRRTLDAWPAEGAAGRREGRTVDAVVSEADHPVRSAGRLDPSGCPSALAPTLIPLPRRSIVAWAAAAARAPRLRFLPQALAASPAPSGTAPPSSATSSSATPVRAAHAYWRGASARASPAASPCPSLEARAGYLCRSLALRASSCARRARVRTRAAVRRTGGHMPLPLHGRPLHAPARTTRALPSTLEVARQLGGCSFQRLATAPGFEGRARLVHPIERRSSAAPWPCTTLCTCMFVRETNPPACKP
jgi:hypothetical protein